MMSRVIGNKDKRGMYPSQRCSLSHTLNLQVTERQLSSGQQKWGRQIVKRICAWEENEFSLYPSRFLAETSGIRQINRRKANRTLITCIPP